MFIGFVLGAIGGGDGGNGSSVVSDMSQLQDVQGNPGCACFTCSLLCFSFLIRKDRREKRVVGISGWLW
jgi:hypothetical protein